MKLIAFFSLDAMALPDGRVRLTQKIVEGLTNMAHHWPGRVVAVFAPAATADTNLDPVWVVPGNLPFDVVVETARGDRLQRFVESASVVQVGVDHRHVDVVRACRRAGVPVVVVGEFDLRTRLQIAAAEEPHLNRRMRRAVWELIEEARQRWAISVADGLQCNGTPAFDAWGSLNTDPLLFFDSRVQAHQLASRDQAARRGKGRGLTLAFSGRFIPMKGVLHLAELAHHLRTRSVAFHLRIFGGGPLEPAMRAHIERLGLSGHVTLEGTLPFAGLMEEITRSVDIFVCTHVQGDPSCTYLETMACAVPIAGFENDAWRGLLVRSHAGWSAPVANAGALAEVIAQLAERRDDISRRALAARDFASRHTFATTFAQRMGHLLHIARRTRGE